MPTVQPAASRRYAAGLIRLAHDEDRPLDRGPLSQSEMRMSADMPESVSSLSATSSQTVRAYKRLSAHAKSTLDCNEAQRWTPSKNWTSQLSRSKATLLSELSSLLAKCSHGLEHCRSRPAAFNASLKRSGDATPPHMSGTLVPSGRPSPTPCWTLR